ncbi:hypothetical protein FKW77_006980 [Venturia effusa]|uniref:Heme haloperoxidase family profile domain-containing protein n=1 Tax=Venturia effusa TaxID=50376 RepID=A0A517L5Q1_9PEZI|nr:hypothetical protein FKW77_006980 [Venturia effusa]
MKPQSLISLILPATVLVNGQCPNEIFPAYAMIPILKSKLMQVIENKKLLDLPTQDFPTGFPAGSTQSDYHPIWCSIGYQNDIRQIFLSINWLLQASCAVPYVDCTGNGDACNYPIFNALGGENKQINPGLVPTTVATILGTPVLIGEFDPPNAAYKQPTPGRYSSTVQNAFLFGITNFISGPSFLGKLMDMRWQSLPPDQQPKYSLRAWKHIINLPLYLTYYKTCARNNYYTNSTFNEIVSRVGSVTLYGKASLLNPFSGGLFSPINPAVADSTGTIFEGVEVLQEFVGDVSGIGFALPL